MPKSPHGAKTMRIHTELKLILITKSCIAQFSCTLKRTIKVENTDCGENHCWVVEPVIISMQENSSWPHDLHLAFSSDILYLWSRVVKYNSECRIKFKFQIKNLF